jgi:hypothetical protein
LDIISSAKYSKDILYLEQNLDKIDWIDLSQNPYAIPLFEKYPEKIDWFWVSANPNAISILEANLDKINWCSLS